MSTTDDYQMPVRNHIDSTDRNRVHDITIAEVQACPLFAHLSDEEAQEVIDTIKRFSLIIYHCYTREKVKKML